MCINIELSAEVRHIQRPEVIFSPSGKSCCFLVTNIAEVIPHFQSQLLKRINFIDLIDESQNNFEFPDEKLSRINCVYWLSDHFVVFLSTDGTSFKQTMYRVNIQENPCMQKVCERIYALPNEIFKECRIVVISRISLNRCGMFWRMEHFDYVTWVDGRTENGSCTALYLIPQNPSNHRLKLRKFAMNLCTKSNKIFKTDEVMLEQNVANMGQIMGTPFIRNNQLLFRICRKLWDDWEDEGEFDENTFIFGVFVSVDVEKLQEVEGLEYEEKDIKENTSAYKIYKWTELMKQWAVPFYVGELKAQQVGKYIMFESTHADKHSLLVINLEDQSYSKSITSFEYDMSVLYPSILLVHPSGCILKLSSLAEYGSFSRSSLRKVSQPWKHSRLEDIVRRNVILNKEIDPLKRGYYKNIIYPA